MQFISWVTSDLYFIIKLNINIIKIFISIKKFSVIIRQKLMRIQTDKNKEINNIANQNKKSK